MSPQNIVSCVLPYTALLARALNAHLVQSFARVTPPTPPQVFKMWDSQLDQPGWTAGLQASLAWSQIWTRNDFVWNPSPAGLLQKPDGIQTSKVLPNACVLHYYIQFWFSNLPDNPIDSFLAPI